MTRGQIKAAARAESGIGSMTPAPANSLLTPGADDPQLLDRWLDNAVSELCRVTDYTYLTMTSDITAGLAAYCLPDLQFFESAQAVPDATVGSLPVPLAILSLREFHSINPSWQSAQAAAIMSPSYLILEGASRGVLYPVPTYSAAGGFIVRGFGQVTNSAWPRETDECPLLPRSHDAIVYRLAQRLCERSRDAAGALRCEKEWKRGKCLLEGEMNTLSESHRHRFPGSSAQYGGFNPLDL